MPPAQRGFPGRAMSENPGKTTQRRPDTRTLVKYTLAQMPDIVIFIVVMLILQHWLNLSTLLVALLIGLWILKDVLMFPVLRRSFESNRPEDAQPMIGARGVARDRLDPEGYVWVQGELWRAELVEGHPPIEPGAPLRVESLRGLTLVVAREEAPPGALDTRGD